MLTTENKSYRTVCKLVEYLGQFNKHFVKDADIAFFSSGTLLLLSVSIKAWRVPLTLGGSLFVILHGMFYIQMLVVGMAPSYSDVLTEAFVIILPSILTVALLIWQLLFKPQDKFNFSSCVKK